MSTTDQIAAAVQRCAFRFNTEADLQASLAVVFAAAGIQLAREHRLNATERPDFYHLADGIAVEVKIQGSASSVLRQLYRYAQHDDVRAVLLVTAEARMQAAVVPGLTMAGKPVRAVHIRRGDAF